MTVSTTTNRISYTGDGVSVAFTVPFLFLANADISVYVAGVQVTTGFTTTGQGVGSGTVTFVTAPANGALVVLVRIPDFLQNTALPSNGPFPATSVETMSDKSMIGLQRLQDLQGRSLVLSDGDAAATLTLPLLADRSSKFLAFDSSGLPVAASGATGLPATATGAALLAAANAAAARAVLASGLTGDALFLTATSAAARAVLGSGAVGDALFLAASKTAGYNALAPLRGFLAGLTLSTAGSSATFSVAAGEAADSTNAALLLLAASISKTTSAWAVGTAAGGLDTGTIANNTWYHPYLIRRPDTGVVDVVISTNASAPALPANYTQYRRLGGIKTNGSAQWTSFVQMADDFQWGTAVLDVNASNPGTAAVTRTLTVPTGVRVVALTNAMHRNTGAAAGSYQGLLSDLDVADTDAGLTTALSNFGSSTADSRQGVQVRIRTNTSAQIRSRLAFSDASSTLFIATLGWTDLRGKDA